MLDPWKSLAALSLQLAGAPGGPDAETSGGGICPEDMRLVEGRHYENVAHLCLDSREEGKFHHCYAFAEGFSILSGPVTEIRVCMDRYEAPNRYGAKPTVLASYESSAKWCARAGKRLCTEREWELACAGPDHRPWCYGWRVDTRLCNSGRAWKKVDFEAFDGDRKTARRETDRLWQGTPSGRYDTCVSPFGIHDMMGNVEEWVQARSSRRWPGALMGGFWAKPWTGCRGTNDAHQPTFAFYETGFRCCKDPEEPQARGEGPATRGEEPAEQAGAPE